jgi:uncharacterized protein YqgQ
MSLWKKIAQNVAQPTSVDKVQTLFPVEEVLQKFGLLLYLKKTAHSNQSPNLVTLLFTEIETAEIMESVST